MIEGGYSVNRKALVSHIQQAQRSADALIRRAVIDAGRIDVLAQEVLGYDVMPFHLSLMKFQMAHPSSLQLAFRGSGKTTVLTVCRTIHHIILNRDVRVLLCSKTAGLAQNILREVKNHLRENESLKRIFGEFYSDDDKWDTNEIIVKGRKAVAKESTVSCLGIGGQAVGKHFDVIICDDLVDEENARTQYMRNQLRTWYYKVLHPTLEPHGELHVIGTRYHYADLYGHLMENEMKDCTQIIPALNEDDRSPWPSKYPSEWFQKKRQQLGVVIFNSQYQCDTESMKGEMFQMDWMNIVQPGEVPKDAAGFVGVDLAIKESETADKFAMVAIRVTPNGHIYIVNTFDAHMSFSKQTDKVIEWWKDGAGGTIPRDKMTRVGIEINAYQQAQYQVLKEREPDMSLKPITTLKDKVTRGWKLAAKFEEGKVHIVHGAHYAIMEHLLLFPGGRYRDLFDALDLAVTAAFQKRRRSRERSEPGLI